MYFYLFLWFDKVFVGAMFQSFTLVLGRVQSFPTGGNYQFECGLGDPDDGCMVNPDSTNYNHTAQF